LLQIFPTNTISKLPSEEEQCVHRRFNPD